MERQKKGFIVITVILVVSVAMLLVNLGGETKDHRDVDFIARLYITGEILEAGHDYNQQWLLDTIDELSEDEHNKGILLVIDSPGGAVYEADEAYLALKEYRKKTNRPIHAYFKHIAASGGYYIACAANKIVANRNTITGSIGVIGGQSVDVTDLASTLGIKMKTFTAGRNKNMLNYDSPLTDEQEKIMHDFVYEAYDQFTQIVAESRGMRIEDVRELADGRIYTALQAKKNGLVDDVSDIFVAEDELNKVCDSNNTLEFYDYEFKYEETFQDLIGDFGSFLKSPIKSLKSSVQEESLPSLRYMAY